jgi:hypothetical protein
MKLTHIVRRGVGILLVLSAVVNILYHSRLPPPDRYERLREFHKTTPPSSVQTTSDVRIAGNFSSWFGKRAIQFIKTNKKGKIESKSITVVKLGDLKGIGDDSLSKNLTLAEASQGREELLAILEDAGVTDIDPASIAKLPLWEDVKKLYGDGPVIHGLETCQRFRDTIPKEDASVAPAGLFNTGTNPFAMYISANCKMPYSKNKREAGMKWQAPWGKHMLADYKWNNTAKNDAKVNKTNVMPVVLIRDPYSWMQASLQSASRLFVYRR